MKSIEFKILLFLFVIVLIGWITTSSGSKQRLREIKTQLEKNEQYTDSLNAVWDRVADSTVYYHQQWQKEKALRVAAEIERERAKEKTQLAIQGYEKIIFKHLANDSIRYRKLSELYPSFDPF